MRVHFGAVHAEYAQYDLFLLEMRSAQKHIRCHKSLRYHVYSIQKGSMACPPPSPDFRLQEGALLPLALSNSPLQKFESLESASLAQGFLRGSPAWQRHCADQGGLAQ